MIAGDTIGRWTLQHRIRRPGRAVWSCLCACGAQAEVLETNLRRGLTRSCGCAKRTRRGQSRSRPYTLWRAMLARCYLPKNKRYDRYGARGIVVCDRWRNSFDAFLADMGEPPPGLTLERRDNDGNYEPGNCIWATRTAQARNRASTKLTASDVGRIRAICAAGVAQAKVARGLGISKSHVSAIIHGRTWAPNAPDREAA